MNAVLDLTELDRRFGIPDIARVCGGHGGFTRVEIDSPLAHGEIYLHGAHVTSWRPAGSEEVLFLSTKSRWEEGQAIRGGIPICFPWFRSKADDAHAPAHGFVRTRSWQLYSIVENNAGVAVTMFIESDEQTRRWWPEECRLVHRITFGSELRLELICINTGKTQFHFEEALHTYNRVADVKDVCLQGLAGIRFFDNIDSNKERMQLGDRHIVKNLIFGKNVVIVEWSFEAAHRGGLRWYLCNRSSGEVAGLWGLRIRPGPSTGHRSPYLFRRHDTTHTDFITPASGAAESSDIVVRFTYLFKGTDCSVIRLRRPQSGQRPIPRSNGRRLGAGALFCGAEPSGEERDRTSTSVRSR